MEWIQKTVLIRRIENETTNLKKCFLAQGSKLPPPAEYKADVPIKDIKIITAGRIVAFRKMGKASFIHIQDMKEKIQIYIKTDLIP